MITGFLGYSAPDSTFCIVQWKDLLCDSYVSDIDDLDYGELAW